MTEDFKFQPKTPLPSIETFQLDYIINNLLKDESEQVVEDLLKVTSNYQNDLRKEIKHKLSIEQRIQFKNIEIAKLSKSLNSTIVSRNRKLKKALTNHDNNEEAEVNQLLKHTIETSNKMKSLIERLTKLERQKSNESVIINKKEMFPRLFKLVEKMNKEDDPDITTQNDVTTQNDITIQNDIKPTYNLEESTPKSNHSEDHIPIYNESVDRSSNQESIAEMDPLEFETFISSTIAKYRESQCEPSEPQTNPLNLLYSQLIPPVKSYPFSNLLPIKSSATVNQSSHISHFKKLRINGAPLTTKENLSGMLEDLKVVDDDEVWNSSGLNTDLSSDSSDSDSSSDNISSTDQYYSNLKNDLRKKRRKFKRKDLSPSPKHKPSHHILQPKRSILKIKQQKKQKPPTTNLDHHEITPLSAANNAYGSKTKSILSDFTVSGIISKEEEPINRLKNYI